MTAEGYLNKDLGEYIKDLSMRKMTPGGGSAAALTASLGVALNLMAINYSLKPNESCDCHEELSDVKVQQQRILDDLSLLIDKDCEVFKELMDSLSSGEDVQNKYINAANVPMDVCRECVASMDAVKILSRKFNKNIITDLQGAVYLLKAAFYSARLNVEINLEQIEDTSFVEGLREELKGIEETLITVEKDIENNIKDAS